MMISYILNLKRLEKSSAYVPCKEAISCETSLNYKPSCKQATSSKTSAIL